MTELASDLTPEQLQQLVDNHRAKEAGVSPMLDMRGLGKTETVSV